MRSPEDFVRKRAVHKHLGPTLNESLDLRLPLLRSDMAGHREQTQNLLGAFRLAEQFVERTSVRYAFAALTSENDRAALLHNPGCCAHSFYPLVQIQIERIAAVRCDDQIKGRLDPLHGGAPHKFIA